MKKSVVLHWAGSWTGIIVGVGLKFDPFFKLFKSLKNGYNLFESLTWFLSRGVLHWSQEFAKCSYLLFQLSRSDRQRAKKTLPRFNLSKSDALKKYLQQKNLTFMRLASEASNCPKKSHSTLRAKRATFTFWVTKSWLKMPKIVNFGEFLKTGHFW